MARRDLIQQIKRYQNYIISVDPPEIDAPKILHYIRKLSKLPIKFEELEETGIGKTINGLRKRNGNIGEEAALLVAKWKSIVKKQVEEEEEEEEQSLKREKSKKESQSNNSVKRKFEGDDGPRKLVKKEQSELKSEQKCDVKAKHLITLKSRNKRKHSEQLDDEKSRKYAKMQTKERKESNPSPVQLKSDTVNVSLDKAESSHSDEVDPDFEKGQKERSHEDKKHKKGHEKRHKTSKHSHKSDRQNRHHSKSSHQEKKLIEENEDSSQKHHRSDSKSKSRSESKKEDRKHESSKTKTSSTNEKKSKNVLAASVENHVDSTTGDDFGSALLNIPNTTSPPTKKRSTSSKASTYQDSMHSPSSQKSLTNFDMFSTSMKLEPLDVIDSIEDADFYASPNANAQTRSTSHLQSEEDMLNSMIVTKNQKTKVYSGNKCSIANVPTLFELCARVLQDNFDALEYTGGVPYNILKTILEKVTAQQLYTFENYNPYLIEETDDLWKYHAKKEFRKAERLEYETWRDLYLRCFEEREAKLQALTKNISETIANSAPVRKTQLAYFDTTVKPPRNVARSQAKNGTGGSNFSKSSKQTSPTATQSLKERLTKDVMGPNAIQVPSKANSLVKKKKAPLMQKSLQLMKGLKR